MAGELNQGGGLNGAHMVLNLHRRFEAREGGVAAQIGGVEQPAGGGDGGEAEADQAGQAGAKTHAAEQCPLQDMLSDMFPRLVRDLIPQLIPGIWKSAGVAIFARHVLHLRFCCLDLAS